MCACGAFHIAISALIILSRMLKPTRLLSRPTLAVFHPPALSLPRQTLRPGTRLIPSKAADESKPEAYPRGYVEDFDESRRKLADVFSILLPSLFMTVRCEIAKPRRETSARSREDPMRTRAVR